MFSDVCPARTTAAILLMLIATTSSRTCAKPIVGGSFVTLGLFYAFLPLIKILHKTIVGMPMISVSTKAAEKNPDASFPIRIPQYSACIVIHTATIIRDAIVKIPVKMITIILVGRVIFLD